MAKMAGFAESLAKDRGTGRPRLLTPEDPAHAWCAVACPMVLGVRVSSAGGGPPDALVPLLPLIFEKLLGRPLDSAPWGVPVVRVSRHGSLEGAAAGADASADADGDDAGAAADGAGGGAAGDASSIRVAAAVPVPPPAKEGLFEVSTALGPAILRLDGLVDTACRCQVPADEALGRDAVLVLSLPSDWLDGSLLRAAWSSRSVELLGDGAEEGGERWAAWLSQWGEVIRLELSAHAGEREADGFCLLAATFADPAARDGCETALGGGRLLVLEGPQRAADPHAKCLLRSQFDEQVDHAWKEHLVFEQEISRIDGGIVLDDAAEALPSGPNMCFRPLCELFERWLRVGTLHATSTVCAQKRLHEADASASSRSLEAFRRSAWHAAFRVCMQVEPTDDNAHTLCLALTEHWRKANGICVDADTEDLLELAEVLKEVWKQSKSAQDALRRSAEEEAASAEKALLEELEEEEGRAARDKERKKKLKQKERQRKSDRGGAPAAASPASSPTASPDASPAAPPAAEPDGLLAPSAALAAVLAAAPPPAPAAGGRERPASGAQAAKKGATPGATPGARCPAATAGGAGTGARPDGAAQRRAADLDAILEAVRKSEELHHAPASTGSAASLAGTPPFGPASRPAGKDKSSTRKAKSRTGAATASPGGASTAWEVSSSSSASLSEHSGAAADAERSMWPSTATRSDPAAEPAASGRAAPAAPAGSAAPVGSAAPAAAAALVLPAAPTLPDLPAASAAPAAPTPTPSPAVSAPTPKWSDIMDDAGLDEAEDAAPASPSASPSKRRSRRRGSGGETPQEVASTCASTVSGGSGSASGSKGSSLAHSDDDAAQGEEESKRRGVVTWTDLGLGVGAAGGTARAAGAVASAAARGVALAAPQVPAPPAAPAPLAAPAPPAPPAPPKSPGHAAGLGATSAERAFGHALVVDVGQGNDNDDARSDDDDDEGDLLSPGSPGSPSKRRNRRRRRRGDKSAAAAAAAAAAGSDDEAWHGGAGAEAGGKSRGVVTWDDLGLGLGFGSGAKGAKAACPLEAARASAPPQLGQCSPVCLSTMAASLQPASPARGPYDASDRFAHSGMAPWSPVTGSQVAPAPAVGSPSAASWGVPCDASERFAWQPGAAAAGLGLNAGEFLAPPGSAPAGARRARRPALWCIPARGLSFAWSAF